ncbi:hypothetical protein BDV97DRAFT_359933 [Delphinella strobiligena]|nr:hypothetical protein BDV97DRAFT_359933 [Delphinella strobiligena]
MVLYLLLSWRHFNREIVPAFFVPDPITPGENTHRSSRWINPPNSAHALFRPAFLPGAEGTTGLSGPQNGTSRIHGCQNGFSEKMHEAL